MPQLEVQSVKAKPSYEGKFGVMYPFHIGGLLDGQTDVVEMSFKKPENAPKPGDTIEVEITANNEYGKKAKKVQSFTASGDGGGSATRSYGKSPEEQASIGRQNALSNATTLQVERARMVGKPELLTTDKVVEVATALAAFNNGQVKPEPTPEKNDKDIEAGIAAFDEEE
jgi:hypothetical protein